MPGMTPVLGIRYPCSGDTIDSSVFANFTNDIQAALLTGDAAVASAANRPAAQVQGETPTQSVVINTATVMTYTTEVFDNDDMADIAVNNDRLTIVTGGLYLCGAQVTTLTGFATISSMTVNLTVNGTTVYRYKTPGFGFGSAQINRVPLDLNAGDILRAETRWTGTGGPANLSYRELTAEMIASH